MFKVTKKNVVDIFEKSNLVASRSFRQDFRMRGLVTIEKHDQSVHIFTTNGYVELHCFIDPGVDANFEVQDSESDKVTVDVNVLLNALRAMGGKKSDNHIIHLVVDRDGSLIVNNLNSKSKKSTVKLACLNMHHMSSRYEMPSDSTEFDIESSVFQRGVKSVNKYASPIATRTKYRMLCIHFTDDDIRFVCGDGNRYAVKTFEHSYDLGEKVINQKFVFPVEQLLLLSELATDTEWVNIKFINHQDCIFEPKNSNIKAILKGMPNEEFIAYEKHGYRISDAIAQVDVLRTDFLEAAQIAQAVRDSSVESEHMAHSVGIACQNNEMIVKVDEGKYRCEHTMECVYDSDSIIHETYLWRYINDLAHASASNYIRLYFSKMPNTKLLLMAQTMETLDQRSRDDIFMFIGPTN